MIDKEIKIDFPKFNDTRVFFHTSEDECIYYVDNYINSYPDGFTKEKLIKAIKINTKQKSVIFIGTTVRESLGDCKHYYDAQPGASGWTNDN